MVTFGSSNQTSNNSPSLLSGSGGNTFVNTLGNSFDNMEQLSSSPSKHNNYNNNYNINSNNNNNNNNNNTMVITAGKDSPTLTRRFKKSPVFMSPVSVSTTSTSTSTTTTPNASPYQSPNVKQRESDKDSSSYDAMGSYVMDLRDNFIEDYSTRVVPPIKSTLPSTHIGKPLPLPQSPPQQPQPHLPQLPQIPQVSSAVSELKMQLLESLDMYSTLTSSVDSSLTTQSMPELPLYTPRKNWINGSKVMLSTYDRRHFLSPTRGRKSLGKSTTTGPRYLTITRSVSQYLTLRPKKSRGNLSKSTFVGEDVLEELQHQEQQHKEQQEQQQQHPVDQSSPEKDGASISSKSNDGHATISPRRLMRTGTLRKIYKNINKHIHSSEAIDKRTKKLREIIDSTVEHTIIKRYFPYDLNMDVQTEFELWVTDGKYSEGRQLDEMVKTLSDDCDTTRTVKPADVEDFIDRFTDKILNDHKLQDTASSMPLIYDDISTHHIIAQLTKRILYPRIQLMTKAILNNHNGSVLTTKYNNQCREKVLSMRSKTIQELNLLPSCFPSDVDFSYKNPFEPAISIINRIPSLSVPIDIIYIIQKTISCIHTISVSLLDNGKKFSGISTLSRRGNPGPWSDTTALGADELFPLFVFVLIHSEVIGCSSFVVSLLQHFTLNDLETGGEFGWCSASFHAAIAHLNQL
ncbi:hypothetical protein SAMD00019534_056440 [Acytostelium subglobosum LB1]|uniref:hypothetical protein n=1 Tax=Acytostelium subglobosum LB1 TaxID=1410327 RepID=UPI000644FE0C|nr:hypothetical protein SAMD00019534_056440 [Acytostelium subglobosum LB1]GAM22469.1 hypothetical protein SAMD00019534_056440 [Acytostelium subglobosum LB1]|eukprot:XP_012754589.1 hypothetical protein SAMD00019534_056440 [Acytostelium subglobosum LB1]